MNDTTDVVYPPDDFLSDALIDRVAQKVLERRPSQTKSRRLQEDFAQDVEIKEESNNLRSLSLRKPVIKSGPMGSIEELGPFFRHISLSSYEAVYSTRGVDHDYLQRWLLEDIFASESS